MTTATSDQHDPHWRQAFRLHALDLSAKARGEDRTGHWLLTAPFCAATLRDLAGDHAELQRLGGAGLPSGGESTVDALIAQLGFSALPEPTGFGWAGFTWRFNVACMAETVRVQGLIAARKAALRPGRG